MEINAFTHPIGFTHLTEALKGCARNGVYLFASVRQYMVADAIPMNHYQLFVQVEAGPNVRYWLLDFGAECQYETDAEKSQSKKLAAAERAVRDYLARRGIIPQPGVIAFSKDLVLCKGGYSDFMAWDPDTREFVLK